MYLLICWQTDLKPFRYNLPHIMYPIGLRCHLNTHFNAYVFFPKHFCPPIRTFHLFGVHFTWDYYRSDANERQLLAKRPDEPLFGNYLFPIFCKISNWNWRLNNWNNLQIILNNNNWIRSSWLWCYDFSGNWSNIKFCIYRLCLWLNDE